MAKNTDRNNEQDESIIDFFKKNNIEYGKNYLWTQSFLDMDLFKRFITFTHIMSNYIMLFEENEIKLFKFGINKNPNPVLVLNKNEIKNISLSYGKFMGDLIIERKEKKKLKFKVIVADRKWAKDNLDFLEKTEWISK